MSGTRISVLLIDDHRIVREGLAQVIDREPDMRVAATAASEAEAVALYARHRPDLTIMDLQLRGGSGVGAIRAIRSRDPSARIVVLTMMRGDEDIHRALEAGAATYLLKDTAIADLTRVIREVHAGKTPRVSAEVKAQMAARAERPALTGREVQVLELVRRGLRNREVGASLGISEETVQSHVRSILSKLDVPDRTAAVDVALRRGILHLQ
jgi:two-component system, NarL family, response regulator